MKNVLACLAVAASVTALPAWADEGKIKKTLELRLPGEKIEQVRKTPYNGLYEFTISDRIFYTDPNVSYLFVGSVVDAKTKENLTAESYGRLRAAVLQELPRELAVKTVRGSGKRTLITFEDPNCTFCKQLAPELAKLDNVTIYTYLWPILSESSLTKSRAVWCSKDRSRAWRDMMLNGAAPSEVSGCDFPADKIADFAQRRLRLQGTPAIFTADGMEYGGPRTASALDQALGGNKK